MRTVGVLTVLVMVAAACGDGDTMVFSATTQADTTTMQVATTATVAPTTAASSTTAISSSTVAATTVPVTTSTTVSPPTATLSLAGFFQAARDLDVSIRAAADLFNASYDSAVATVSATAAAAIGALDTGPVGALVPPGLSLDLETAVLGVFADLNSRVAALQGAVRLLNGHAENVAEALDCLSNGAMSAARFVSDLDAAVALAGLERPPTAAVDSIPAGVLAARLETIRSMNFGCDSCGGIAYTEAIPIDWDAKLIMEGVEFEATFDGTAWQILIYAC